MSITNIDVSYVLTVYNKAAVLPLIIENILRQNIKNFEIIFIDDNSSDNSLEVIKNATSDIANVIIITNNDNKGPAIRLNQGVKRARGRYLHLFDCDDIAPRNTSSYMLYLAEKYDADLIYGKYAKTDLSEREIIANDQGLYIDKNKDLLDNATISDNPLQEVLKYNHTHINLFITRQLFLKSGGCDERIFIQDESLALRSSYAAKRIISLHYPTIFAPRKGDNNLSVNLEQQHHDRFLAYYYAILEFGNISDIMLIMLYRKAVSSVWKAIKKQKIYKYYYFLFYYIYVKLAKPKVNSRLLDFMYKNIIAQLVKVRKVKLEK